MFIGIAMFFVLMLMGGLIAFLGDKIGSKVGKKRMTLFGLRPKYTSIIVTIISGVLISFLTVAVLAVVNENVRVALFGLSKLQAQMANLNQEIIVKNKELDEGKKQLEARNKEYEGVTKKSEKTVKELERVESQRHIVRIVHPDKGDGYSTESQYGRIPDRTLNPLYPDSKETEPLTVGFSYPAEHTTLFVLEHRSQFRSDK